MRKLVLSLAAAGAALVVASPAAAQYYPAPQPYGYGQPYGYNNGPSVHALQHRIDAIQQQINQLGRYNGISDRSVHQLQHEAHDVEHRLRGAARYGLNGYEANDIQRRIARLEQRVQYSMSRGYGRYGYNGYNSGQFVDRDRDGRDDRYENDRGWDHDD